MLRTILCVGLLGSAAAIFLGPNAVISAIAIGVFATCLLVALVRVLRGASQRIDRILFEEMNADNDSVKPGTSHSDHWRKSA